MDRYMQCVMWIRLFAARGQWSSVGKNGNEPSGSINGAVIYGPA